MTVGDNDALPSGWTWTTLGATAVLSKRKVNPQEVPDIPYLGLEHVEAGTSQIVGCGTAKDVKSTKNAFSSGDVLYGKLRPYLNKVAQPKFDGVCSTDFLVFAPSPVLDSRFFAHFISRPEFVDFAHHSSNGVELPRVSWKSLAKFPIALPPLAEQRRLAKRLDAAECLRLAIRTRTRKVSTTLDRVRRAVVAAACSGGLTHDWREGHPETTSRALYAEHQSHAAESKSAGRDDFVQEALLESIPPSWSVVRLGDILEVATGATPLRKNSAFYDGGSIPWVTSGAVNGGTITSATELITPFALEETNVKLFPPGTLLIAMYGEGQTRGRVGELGIEACTNQAVAALMFTQMTARIRPFVRLFFEDSYLRMRTQSAGGVQPNLNLRIIKDTLVPLPPHEEQVEIVQRASAALKIVDRLAAQVDGVEGTLDRALNSVLGKAFRGELVPTEAAIAREERRGFESAEELLARKASRGPAPYEDDDLRAATEARSEPGISLPDAEAELNAG